MQTASNKASINNVSDIISLIYLNSNPDITFYYAGDNFEQNPVNLKNTKLRQDAIRFIFNSDPEIGITKDFQEKALKILGSKISKRMKDIITNAPIIEYNVSTLAPRTQEVLQKITADRNRRERISQELMQKVEGDSQSLEEHMEETLYKYESTTDAVNPLRTQELGRLMVTPETTIEEDNRKRQLINDSLRDAQVHYKQLQDQVEKGGRVDEREFDLVTIEMNSLIEAREVINKHIRRKSAHLALQEDILEREELIGNEQEIGQFVEANREVTGRTMDEEQFQNLQNTLEQLQDDANFSNLVEKGRFRFSKETKKELLKKLNKTSLLYQQLSQDVREGELEGILYQGEEEEEEYIAGGNIVQPIDDDLRSLNSLMGEYLQRSDEESSGGGGSEGDYATVLDQPDPSQAPSVVGQQAIIVPLSLDPKYHIDALKEMYNYKVGQRIDWDTTLVKSIQSLNLTKDQINKYIDSLIDVYGSKLLIFKRMSDGDVVEYIELRELQFSFERGMHIGNRTKQALINVDDLESLTNAAGVSGPPAPEDLTAEDQVDMALSQTTNSQQSKPGGYLDASNPVVIERAAAVNSFKNPFRDLYGIDMSTQRYKLIVPKSIEFSE